LDKIVTAIREAKSFLVTTHYLPDGDGLGSQMAFHRAMRGMDKVSFVVNSSPTPEKFQLVDPHHEIGLYSPQTPLPEADLILVMDTSDYQMLGPMEAPLRAAKSRLIFVDHHLPEIAEVGEHLIRESFGSTGELVFQLLKDLQAPIDRLAAVALYTAIITDTNHFRFKRTTPSSHRAAAELLEKGVLPEDVYQAIYAHDSQAKVRLLGDVLKDLGSTPDGRIIWLTIPATLRRHYGATVEDTESFVNQLTLIEGASIGIVFREDDDGRIKVSIRGNGEIPIYAIAKSFGGGGHRQAAGVKIRDSLANVQKQVLAAAEETLRGHA
jgi:phosphoesterase RecJ-like protein